MKDTEQPKQIKRVRSKIGQAIVDFCADHPTFYADNLRAYVALRCGSTAPASADRILRDLRRKDILNYEVISRTNSHYRVLPVPNRGTITPPKFAQGNLSI